MARQSAVAMYLPKDLLVGGTRSELAGQRQRGRTQTKGVAVQGCLQDRHRRKSQRNVCNRSHHNRGGKKPSLAYSCGLVFDRQGAIWTRFGGREWRLLAW